SRRAHDLCAINMMSKLDFRSAFLLPNPYSLHSGEITQQSSGIFDTQFAACDRFQHLAPFRRGQFALLYGERLAFAQCGLVIEEAERSQSGGQFVADGWIGDS